MRHRTLAIMAIGTIVIGIGTTAGHADIVGSVPSAGPPLLVGKNPVTPQHLDLTWGDSCGPDQNDFAIYEGTIGAWYSHTKTLCTTAGNLGVSDLTPGPASSYYLVVALSGTSEGSYGTSSTGAEIPAGVSTCRAVLSTEACQWQRVFVSSVPYPANLGNLSGADLKCQALADAAQLGGTWKAWLSSSAASAATRLTHQSLSYRRVDGVLVAADDVSFFSTAHVNPITRDEHGTTVLNVEVWTGSDGSGFGSGGCADWTANDPGGSFPFVGLNSRSDAGWSTIYLQFCDRLAHLYCIEQ